MTAVLSVTLPLIALLLFSNLYSTQAFNRKNCGFQHAHDGLPGGGAWRSSSDSVNDFSHRVDGERRLPHAVGR